MGNYVTEAEVRAEGAPASASSATINSRIVKWEALVEKLTSNVFRVLTPGELTFDGNDSAILHFSLPLVAVTSVKINDETSALSADEYRAFVGKAQPQDDRPNPKIKLTPLRGTVYRSSPSVFIHGLDQLITATWGYVESDLSTPAPVKSAILQLVLLDLDNYFDQAGTSIAVTPKRRERTDGHEIEWMELSDLKATWAMLPQEVAEILAMYRAPWKITAPLDVAAF